MNNWILVFTLLVSFVVLYLIHNKMIGPSNVLVLSFLIPSILIIAYDDYFSYEISLETILIINFLIGMFSLGEWFLSERRCNLKKTPICQSPIILGKKLYYTFLLITICNTYVQYNYLMQLGALKGASSLLEAYAASRLVLVEYQNTGVIEVARPYYGIVLSLLASIVEIICLHVYILNRVVKNYNDKRLLLIIILFFLSLFFATGRYAFIPIIVHLVYLLIVFLKTKMNVALIFKKYRKTILATLFAGATVFVGLGILRSGTDDNNAADLDAKFTVTTYIAAPIIGLDIFVKDGIERSAYVGVHTFRDFYDYSRFFGVSYKRIQFHKEDFSAGKGSSNVYTGFYYWLSDFGLIGAFIYALILGLICGSYYYRKPNLLSISEIYIRSFLYYSLVMMFYDDQFNNLFSVFMIFTIIVLKYTQKRLMQNRVKVIKKKNILWKK